MGAWRKHAPNANVSSRRTTPRGSSARAVVSTSRCATPMLGITHNNAPALFAAMRSRSSGKERSTTKASIAPASAPASGARAKFPTSSARSIGTGRGVVSSGLADTSRFVSTVSTCSSTAMSWRSISAARSRHPRPCITRTATRQTTESRTWSCGLGVMVEAQPRPTALPAPASSRLGKG